MFGPASFRRFLLAASTLSLVTGLVLLDAGHPPAGATTLIVSLGIISKPGELVICEERRSECVPVSLTRWQEALDMVASVFDSEHVLQRHALHLLGCRSAAERLSGRLLTRPVPSPCCERSTHSILNPASL
jgi:hypothetical protein